MAIRRKTHNDIEANLNFNKRTKRQKVNNLDLRKVNQKDIKIVGLLVAQYNNKQISSELQIPLSTIQRRTRQILEKGLVQHFFKPNYKQLGLKKGMIHVYLADSSMKPTAEKISTMDGITSVSIHIGNSDIVADFVYKDSEQIVDTISSIKKLESVKRIVWSEEAYVLPTDPQNTISQYNKLI